MTAASGSFLMPDDDARRRRTVALALAIAVHGLLLLMLLHLAPPFEARRAPDEPLKVIPLHDETADHLKTHTARAQKAASKPAHAVKAASAPAAATHEAKPNKDAPAQPWVLNPDLAGFNLARTPTQTTDAAPSQSAATAPAPADRDVVATTPGGEELWLFKGWARPPTAAEIDPYLPMTTDSAGHRQLKMTGWGSIACKILPGNRLVDCEELAETPGSGFSRALRQMAWQFRILPPKRNGEVVYNTWVNLCFTFDQDGIAARDASHACVGPWRGLMGKKGSGAFGPTRGSEN